MAKINRGYREDYEDEMNEGMSESSLFDDEEGSEYSYEEDSNPLSDGNEIDVKDADESLARAIELDKGSFSLSMGTISISDIVIPTPIKDSRKETYLGLMRSVEELGVLVPIQVMISEGYAEYVQENGSEEGYDGPKYVLLDGLRRIFASKKNGLDRVNAVIYDFDDKDKGSDMVNILSSILNKVQKKSWSEIWYMYQVLESQSALSPGNIEYLLQLEPGDAMKLKEVMTRRSEFPEPAEDLLSKKKNLQQAYNMLNKMMREQDQLAKEDISGVSDMEETEGVVNDSGSDDKLSDEEVKEILDMESSFDGELSEDEFDAMVGNDVAPERFEVNGDRHLDPALRAAVLQRDNYTCQVSGVGVDSGLPTEIALSILQVHHLVPVADGGTNEMSNLITLTQDPHTLIHVIQRRNGRLGMSKEDFEKLDDDKKDYIKKVMKFARIAVEADRRLGKTREQIREDTSSAMRFKMPGLIQKENMEAIAKSKKS